MGGRQQVQYRLTLSTISDPYLTNTTPHHTTHPTPNTTHQDELFMICLNQRLYRLSRARDPPFFSASLSDEATCGAVDMYVLAASCEEGRVLR